MELLELLGIKLRSLFTELEVFDDSLELGLVDHSGEPTVDILEGFLGSRVQHVLVEVQQRAADGNVSKGDALADQIGSGEQMGVERIQAALDIFLGAISGVLVESHDAYGWVNPRAGGGQDFSVGKRQPLLHECLVQIALTTQLFVGN